MIRTYFLKWDFLKINMRAILKYFFNARYIAITAWNNSEIFKENLI